MTPRLIYDSGGEDFACDYDSYEELNCMVLCVDAVMAATDVLQPKPAAFRVGEFETNGFTVKMLNVLLDSGACHRSYIARSIVKKHSGVWKRSISPFASTVRLANQVTTVHTTEKVRGQLSFVFDSGEEVSAEIDAVVWDIKSMEFILGLPDILEHFLDLFVDISHLARAELLGKIDESKVRSGNGQRVSLRFLWRKRSRTFLCSSKVCSIIWRCRMKKRRRFIWI